MGAEQVKQTVELIIEDYKHLKPEDFKACFNNAKKGHYGKLFDRLDGQIIMQWLCEYDNERDSEIEAYRAKQNRVLKQEPGLVAQLAIAENSAGLEKPDVFKTNMAKLKETLIGNKQAREAERQQQQAEAVKDPVRDMCNGWLKQFDRLREKQVAKLGMVRKYGLVKNPFYREGGKEPKFTGRKLNANDYLEHKHWQYWLANLPREERMKQYLIKYPKHEKVQKEGL